MLWFVVLSVAVAAFAQIHQEDQFVHLQSEERVDYYDELVLVLDASVWNFEYYVNTNPDLYANGIATLEQAQAHWLEYGLSEGRQASGQFHILQYFQRYPQLAAQLDNNLTAGVINYVAAGQAAGRVGVVDGGAYGKYTMYNVTEGFYASASNRTAGAIESIVWNYTEFVNQWDHGRELQLAVTNGSGECYNPTEAGSSNDNTGYATTSQLQLISVSATSLNTSVQPAFWLAPGEPEPNPGPTCHVGINTGLVSAFTMNKSLTLGYGTFPRVLHYQASVYVPFDEPLIQTEGPTQYMPGNFSSFYTIDPSSGQITELSHAPNTMGSTQLPLIFATPDGLLAECAFSMQPPTYYAWFDFSFIAPATDATMKWTMPYIVNNVTAGTWLQFDAFVVVGTLASVQQDVTALYQSLSAK